MSKEISTDNPEELAVYLNSTLGSISLAIQDAVNAAVQEVGKEAVKKLKATSPKGVRPYDYSKGWKYKASKIQADGSFELKVYNAKRGYLTHLVEKGHPIVRGGKVVGRAKAKPHIGPVNDWVQNEGFQQIAKAVQQAISKSKT